MKVIRKKSLELKIEELIVKWITSEKDDVDDDINKFLDLRRRKETSKFTHKIKLTTWDSPMFKNINPMAEYLTKKLFVSLKLYGMKWYRDRPLLSADEMDLNKVMWKSSNFPGAREKSRRFRNHIISTFISWEAAKMAGETDLVKNESIYDNLWGYIPDKLPQVHWNFKIYSFNKNIDGSYEVELHMLVD